MRNLSFIAAAGMIALAIATTMRAEAPGEAPAGRPLPVEVGMEAPGQIHLIERPGLYGLGPEPQGSRYAVVGSSLVRLDSTSTVVRAVIRGGVRPLD